MLRIFIYFYDEGYIFDIWDPKFYVYCYSDKSRNFQIIAIYSCNEPLFLFLLCPEIIVV